MDMMEIRRQMMGVIAGMASGAKYESGEFTIDVGASYYNIMFSQSFDRYMVFVEMTDDSKQQLVESGISGNRMYAFFGVYPKLTIDDVTESNNAWVSRINPSTKAVNTTYSSFNGTSTGFGRGVDTGTTDLLAGYSYKYYVTELK